MWSLDGFTQGSKTKGTPKSSNRTSQEQKFGTKSLHQDSGPTYIRNKNKHKIDVNVASLP